MSRATKRAIADKIGLVMDAANREISTYSATLRSPPPLVLRATLLHLGSEIIPKLEDDIRDFYIQAGERNPKTISNGIASAFRTWVTAMGISQANSIGARSPATTPTELARYLTRVDLHINNIEARTRVAIARLPKKTINWRGSSWDVFKMVLSAAIGSLVTLLSQRFLKPH